MQMTYNGTHEIERTRRFGYPYQLTVRSQFANEDNFHRSVTTRLPPKW